MRRILSLPRLISYSQSFPLLHLNAHMQARGVLALGDLERAEDTAIFGLWEWAASSLEAWRNESANMAVSRWHPIVRDVHWPELSCSYRWGR